MPPTHRSTLLASGIFTLVCACGTNSTALFSRDGGTFESDSDASSTQPVFQSPGSSGMPGSGTFVGHNAGGDGGAVRARTDGGAAPGCDPTCMTAGGTCNGNTCTISENPGNLDPPSQSQLQTGGSGDSSFKWLYPYDKTVFPRGLVSPTLQFASGAADSAYVRITSTTVDYRGYFKISQTPIAFALPQASWDAVAAAALAAEPLEVAVTVSNAGAVTGPIKESWTIATGRLSGIVYHETYNSKLAGAVGIMQIRIGDTQPTVLKSGCGNVCHSASADGSRLVADRTIDTSASYDLANGAALIHAQSNDSFAYGGIYPDGTMLMSSTNYLGAVNTTSKLYDTATGANIAAPGWDGVITRGGTTAFSPDGKQIAFVHEDKDNGHSIAKMDFDMGSKQFSNLIDLVTDSSHTLSWPAFTPDGKAAIFQAGSSTSFITGLGSKGDLYVVDVATRTAQRLDALDGYSGSDTSTYLPDGDPGLSFTPTVLPVAVGGYFWTIFTSHRAYGNILASKANGDALGKLWVAAIDMNAPPGTDPSHPAFFLDGQELKGDNLRGFLTLPPCQKDGTQCASGDQCCGGYCGEVGGDLECTSKPPACSNELDKCNSAADCCNSADMCINGRCATPPPVITR